MPHNKNTDRTRRRLLRWIAGASFLVMAIYLFFPHIFVEEFAGQGAHDTLLADPFADSLDHALPPEIIELPADAPELPPLIPPFLQDEELMTALANEYSLLTLPWLAGKSAADTESETFAPPTTEAPAPADAIDTPAIAQAPAEKPESGTPALPSADEAQSDETTPSLAHLNARDLTRDSASSLPAASAETVASPSADEAQSDETASSLAHLHARDLAPPPENAHPPQQTAPQPTAQAELTASTDTLPEADSSKGEFVKKRFVIQGSNLWTALQKSDLNPHLKKQLEPLRRRLTQGNINRLHILYTDYVKNGSSKPENSKILLVDGLRGATLTWSFYAREKDRKMAFYDYDGNAPELAMDRVPVKYSHITSGFNPARRHPITGRVQPHTGVDLKAAYGAPVHSTGKGTVTFAGWQRGYGWLVIIEHDNGYETRYAHLSAIDAKAGQSVARGTPIGKVGNSGASTGTHLHFEVRVHGTPYDPMTVKIPSAQPLPANYMKTWHYRAEQYRLAMNELGSAAQK
ncbi:MAG: peptidoglycan DD-metalloendopeptidase family protein [Cardiobacteriaceae bacterium]|nr:peptidoglycan DD-metalloendopeptidase family protein [Cardiobacteriaceae bacterium]